MVGEGGSQREQQQSGDSFTNGIAVLVKQATCTIERHARLEERDLRGGDFPGTRHGIPVIFASLERAHIHTFVRAGAIAMVTGQRNLIRENDIS
jgi:hypothetical protein